MAVSPPPPPAEAPAASSRPRISRSPRRRWLMVGVRVVATLVLALLGAVALVLLRLEDPWVKQRMRTLVRASAGLELSYGAAHLDGLSGVTIDGLVLRSSAPLARHAPELLRVRRLRARWSPTLLLGRAPWLADLTLEHAALRLVVDEHGQSSLSSPPGPAVTPERPTPLSHQALAQLGRRLPVSRLHASDVSLVLLRVERGVVVEQDTLQPLTLSLRASPEPPGTRLLVSIGTQAVPEAVLVTRKRPRQRDDVLHARLFARIEATPYEASVQLYAGVDSQTFARGLPLKTLASLDSKVLFDAAHQRTWVQVSQLALVDDAVTSELSLEVPDAGPAIVRHAVGDLDAVRLLPLIEAWDVPLQVGRGQLHYRIEQLRWSGPADDTRLTVEGELADVALRLAGARYTLGNARLSLRGQPRDSALHVEVTAALTGFRSNHGAAMELRADDLTLRLQAERDVQGAVTGEAFVSFAALASGGATSALLRDGELQVQARALQLADATVARMRGDLTFTLAANAMELRGASPLAAEGLSLTVEAPLHGMPIVLRAELAARRLSLRSTRGPVELPLRLRASLRDLVLDDQQLARSSGQAHVTLQGDALAGELEMSLRNQALDYQLQLTASQLGFVQALLPADGVSHVPWQKLSLALSSQGRVERLSAAEPRLKQHSTLQLRGAAFDSMATNKLALEVRSSGTARRHEARADLHVDGLRVGEQVLGNDHVTMQLAYDRVSPALRLDVSSERLTDSQVHARAAFDRKTRQLAYDLDVRLSHLSSLSTLLSQSRVLAGFDLSELDVRLASRGTLAGVITSLREDDVQISPALLRTARGQGTINLTGRHMRWAAGNREVNIPQASWRATFHGDADQRMLASVLESEQAEAALGAHHIAVAGLHDETTVRMTGGVKGVIEHDQHITIRAVQQQLVPAYVLGDLRAVIQARRESNGLIKIKTLELENQAGGSKLAVQGGMELGRDQRTLSMRCRLEQDLSRLSNRKDLLSARGWLAMDVGLSSPDFRLFHTQSTLRLEDASVHLPGQKVELTTMDGELPILSDWLIDRDGLELLRGAQINPYAAQRFADQHPLLSHSSFLSIASVKTPWLSLAPFAANLEVVRNLVSLSQVEMGVRGGMITGSGIFDYNGADSTLDANVRASSVQSSHGEPFDGNAALHIGLRERSVEGRADILRIGRRHLTDLLDFQDPLRADPSINQIRSALRFGYPDRVRISFQHGFASAGVELGGLARLLSINDVRGIPIGPLMERVIAAIEPVEQP